MKKAPSTKKFSKNTSSSKNPPKQASKPKKKNPISKYTKPKTEVVDYFPRGSGPKNDFSTNIGIIDSSKKGSFLSKKRKLKTSYTPKSEKEKKDAKKLYIEKNIEKGDVASVMAPKFKIGDLVLLSICEIHKDYMIMNYTRNKKAMVHSSYSGLTINKQDEFNFEKYFNIGQFVIGAVVSPGNDIRLNNGRLNKKIQVSIDPKIVNTGLNPLKIVVGMDLYGKLIYDKKNNKYSADFKFSFNKKNNFNDNLSEENEESEEDNNNDNDNIEINLIDNEEEEKEKIFKNKKINSYYFFKVIKTLHNSKTKKYQIDISLNLDKYHFPIKNIEFNSLRPGFLFKADVIRSLTNGFEISFGGNVGSIFVDQMPNEKKEKNIMVRIIHLSLNKKMASLSALSHIKRLFLDNIKEKENLIGKLCSVQITKVLYGGSCQGKLIEKNKENKEEKIISENAFLHIKNFPEFKKGDNKDKKNKNEEKMKIDDDNENNEEENESNDESESNEDDIGKKIRKDVKEGDLIDKVIIKEYNYFDDKPIITADLPKESDNFISYETMKVGQFITGIINHIDQKVIYITINNYIEGQIPLVHITDYPLNKMPLKFKLGQKIKARIFSYNKDTKNLILTLKESLQSPEVKLYSDINDMHEGECIYVVYLGNGLYSHSNNIIGTLKNSKSVNEKELKVGKLYKFNVYKIIFKAKKILFSKDNEIWVPNCGDYESFIKRNQIMSNIITVLNTLISSEIEKINEGEIYEFTFVDLTTLIKTLIKKGVNSKLLEENQNALLNEFLVVKYYLKDNNNNNSGNYYGFLIKEQISDYFSEEIFKKMQLFSKNEENDEKVNTYKMLVLYHDKESKNLFVSMKQSLIDNRNKILHISEQIKDINEQKFEENKIYYGFVNKKNDKGITVQFYGKKKLLIKPKDITYNYHPGQTIICKYRKNKFCINSELFFNYSKDEYITESSNKLYYYLTDKEKTTDIILNNQNLKNIEKIEVTIASIEDEYILGKDKDNNDIYISCNLYDFSYKQSEFNLPELSVNSKIEIKLRKINKNEKELIIGEMPEVLIKKLLENGDKLKSEYDTDYISIGDEVLCRITAVKSKYIYTLINNKLIGRMDIEHYQGNLEKIKKLLKETVGLRKMSVESKGSTSSDVTNNYPKELLIKADIIDIIKLQNKLNESDLGIKKKKIKKLKIYKIVPHTDLNDIDFEDDENTKLNSGLTNEPVSTNLDIENKEVNIGIICDIKPLNKHPILLKVKNNTDENKLQIPFNEIPINMVKDDGEIKYKVGQKIKFLYDKKNNSIQIYNNNKNNDKIKSEEIKVGQKYLCRILKKLDGKGLIISIKKGIETFVDICEITDFLHYDPLDFYKIGQLVKCRLLSFDEKTSKYFASLRHSIVNDEEYDIIQNGTTIKFAEKFSSTLSVDLRNKIIKFGSNNILKQNTIAVGYIISSSEKGVFIKLANNITVRAGLNELTDEINILKPHLLFKVNNICICRVISIYDKDPNNIKINVSLKESIIKFPITLHMKDLGLNNFYNCQIIGENKDKKYFVVNIIGSTFTGKLNFNNINNIKSKNVKIGQILILQLIVMEKENKKYEFSSLLIDDNFDKKIIINQLNEEMIKKAEENIEIYKNIQNIITEATKEKEMQELIDMNIEGNNSEGPEEIDYETLIKRKGKNLESDEEEENEDNEDINEEKEDINEDNEDDNNLLSQDKNIIKNKEKIMKIMTKENNSSDEEDEIENEESDEDEENMEIEDEEENLEDKDENEENKETKKKRVSSKKKEKENLKQEINIRKIEEANLNNEIKNAQYYERIILKDHDNSLKWIEYASYILDTLNLSSAREIFERALKIIDIAKTKEKLNIWVAYLNLENIYGNKKTFNKIFERAKEVCDKILLYKHVIQIYLSSKKYEDAYELYKVLTKDYFNDIDIWKQFIEFLFEVNNIQQNEEKNMDILDMKEGLNKSMQVLPKKNHLDIMSWYGQLLYKYNNKEEARNMFDNILKNFPKRKDIWFVYIDKEIKFGKNVDKVRQIFDRMFEIKFKINDLKSVMKKFLEFEKDNCKDENEFIKAQEKTKEILAKRMVKKEDNNNEENDEE